jgi:hypothetical protein
VRYVSEELFADRRFVLAALAQGASIALWRCPESLRADRAVALAAVSADGPALEVPSRFERVERYSGVAFEPLACACAA